MSQEGEESGTTKICLARSHLGLFRAAHEYGAGTSSVPRERRTVMADVPTWQVILGGAQPGEDPLVRQAVAYGVRMAVTRELRWRPLMPVRSRCGRHANGGVCGAGFTSTRGSTSMRPPYFSWYGLLLHAFTEPPCSGGFPPSDRIG